MARKNKETQVENYNSKISESVILDLISLVVIAKFIERCTEEGGWSRLLKIL